MKQTDMQVESFATIGKALEFLLGKQTLDKARREKEKKAPAGYDSDFDD